MSEYRRWFQLSIVFILLWIWAMLWSWFFIGFVAVSSALDLPPGIPNAFTDNDEVLSAISDDVARKFADEYVIYAKTGLESATLRQLSKQLAASHSKKQIFTENIAELGAADQFFMCTTCRATLNVLARMFRDEDGELNGPNAEANSRKLLLDICHRVEYTTDEVCGALFDVYYPVVHYVVMNSLADTRSVCGTLPISFCKVKQNDYNWSLKIDTSKPAVITEPKKEAPKKTGNDLKVLQLTDIHYDPLYKVGSLAECEEPLCCQRTPAGEVAAEKLAGYWSDYRICDAPLHMIDDAFDHIQGTHTDIDYIYQLGDIVPHDTWATTKAGNIDKISAIVKLIEDKFVGIPVYSSVGNHESYPANIFDADNVPEELSVKWLYEHLWSVWSKWLPAEAKDTVLKGGYYTVSPKPGFRIISLNNNDCYLFNFWVFHDGKIGIDQLEWLHDTLLAAEKAGEYVHILAHIPTGDSDCWSVWAREYNRIIERFSAIISGIFNGHTHVDEMNVHYSTHGHAMGISWNGGSLTSYSWKNPNYIVYEMEPDSMQVVDYETWIFNLTEANEHADRSPAWVKEYQFSTTFTDDLSPAGVDALLEKMAENPELLHTYWRYKGTSADPRLEAGCDNKCLLSTICRLATTVYDQKSRCKELKEKLEQNLTPETTDAPLTTELPGTDTTYTSIAPTTPEDDGAASLVAFKLTTIVGFFLCLMKYIM